MLLTAVATWTATAIAQVVDLDECPAPTYASKHITTPVADYFYDALDEYQAQFGVPAVNRTNMYVGYHYPQPCPVGHWAFQVSYDAGAFFFYPQPEVDSCDIDFGVPAGCHTFFVYDGEMPFTWRSKFLPESQVAAYQTYMAAESERFSRLVKKHKAKRERQQRK